MLVVCLILYVCVRVPVCMTVCVCVVCVVCVLCVCVCVCPCVCVCVCCVWCVLCVSVCVCVCVCVCVWCVWCVLCVSVCVCVCLCVCVCACPCVCPCVCVCCVCVCVGGRQSSYINSFTDGDRSFTICSQYLALCWCSHIGVTSTVHCRVLSLKRPRPPHTWHSPLCVAWFTGCERSGMLGTCGGSKHHYCYVRAYLGMLASQSCGWYSPW